MTWPPADPQARFATYKPPTKFFHLAVTPATAECGAEGGILMREVKHVLRETSALYYATNLDGAFFLDELADGVEQCWRELLLPR